MGFLNRNKVLLGVDLGSSCVKIVEFTRQGNKVSVTAYGRCDITDEPQDALRKAIETANTHTRNTVSAVSGRSVIVKYVNMMKMPENELKQAMEFELDKYIPFPVEDCVFDCQKLDIGDDYSEKNNQMKVLITAVKRSLIDEHHQILASCGLNPKIIDVDAFALGNAYEYAIKSSSEVSDEVTALIDVGASKTNISIMKGEACFFTREISVGGNDLTDIIAKKFSQNADEIEEMKKEPGEAADLMRDTMIPVFEDISSEVKLSFDYFENQFDQQVRRVYLSGGSVKFPGIAEAFSELLGISCEVWDPTETLDIDGSVVDVKKIKSEATDLPIAIGLASRIRG